MHGQDFRNAHDEREQSKIFLPVERHLAHHERNGGQRGRSGETNGVAVGRALGDGIDSGEPAGAGTGLDHDLLTEFRAEPGGQGAAEQIGSPAGGERQDELDRLVRK